MENYSSEVPVMEEYQKAYIELIAKRVADEVVLKLESRLVGELEKINKRVHKLELKVFNGFGLKINLLFVLYTVFLGLLIKLAFFN